MRCKLQEYTKIKTNSEPIRKGESLKTKSAESDGPEKKTLSELN